MVLPLEVAELVLELELEEELYSSLSLPVSRRKMFTSAPCCGMTVIVCRPSLVSCVFASSYLVDEY